MQAIILLFAAPIAAIQCIAAAKVESSGDSAGVEICQYHYDLITHARGGIHEKRATQIAAMATAFGVGQLVKVVKLLPIIFRDVATRQGF